MQKITKIFVAYNLGNSNQNADFVKMLRSFLEESGIETPLNEIRIMVRTKDSVAMEQLSKLLLQDGIASDENVCAYETGDLVKMINLNKISIFLVDNKLENFGNFIKTIFPYVEISTYRGIPSGKALCVFQHNTSTEGPIITNWKYL